LIVFSDQALKGKHSYGEKARTDERVFFQDLSRRTFGIGTNYCQSKGILIMICRVTGNDRYSLVRQLPQILNVLLEQGHIFWLWTFPHKVRVSCFKDPDK